MYKASEPRAICLKGIYFALNTGGGTFALRHSGDGACGIPDEDTIVMIGGYDPAHNYVTR